MDEAGGYEPVARRLGARLFGLLFSDQRFLNAYRNLSAPDQSLRLILEFVLDPQEPDSAPYAWSVLPWEHLHDPKRDDPILLRSNVALIRRLSVDTEPAPFTADAPLKVLAILAEPWNADRYGRVEALRALTANLGESQLQVRVVPQPTLPALTSAIEEFNPHVLHVVAHGNFDKTMGGYLALEDDYGKADPVFAADFAQRVAGSGIRLVVLNTCLSAAAGDAKALSGIAQALVRAGVPAVVAMQYSVPVIAAHRFTGELYRALSRKTPLDDAVRVARGVLGGYHEAGPRAWAIPVFYLQVEQTILVRGEAVSASPQIEEKQAPTNLQTAAHLRPSLLPFESLSKRVALLHSPASAASERPPPESRPPSGTMSVATSPTASSGLPPRMSAPTANW